MGKTHDLNEREASTMLMAYELGLEAYFWHVLKGNPAKTLPYHSNQHLFTVALNGALSAKDENLDFHTVKNLFIAGLYHDWNHTGTSDEGKNIPAALAGFRNAMKIPTLQLGKAEVWDVERLISATDSRRDKSIPLLADERIIRDADLSQWAEPDYEAFLEGLSEEFGTDVTAETTKQFLSQKPLKTQWVRDKLHKAGWV